MSSFQEDLLKMIQDVVNQVIDNANLRTGSWRLGEVQSVISSTQLKVYVDGSTTAITIPCNPSVTFAIGDNVWVININGNPRDRFVLCKRGI